MAYIVRSNAPIKLTKPSNDSLKTSFTMSKLDSFIRRMQAQQACINAACEMIGAVPGVVFELGLGLGRTYSHLCEKLPEREIYVFERAVSNKAVCIPPEHRLRLGELADTLPVAVDAFRGNVALVHTDIGSADPDETTQLARFIGEHLVPALAANALVMSDQELDLARLDRLALPDGIAENRYFIYRNHPRHAAGSSAA